jgi:hypothetical protein
VPSHGEKNETPGEGTGPTQLNQEQPTQLNQNQ